jgi:hypothetical protein
MKLSRRLQWIGVLLLILVCGLWLSIRRGPTSFPVPDQNGYQDFLDAAALVHGVGPDYSNQQALRAWVSQNSEAYEAVRAGFGKASSVPIQVSKAWADKHASVEVPRLKWLTTCLIARGKLAELEGRNDAAFDSFMDAYRLADAIGRRGLALDFLNRISCKALVLRDFKSLIPSLSHDQRDEARRLIERIESEQESPELVVGRGRRWRDATYGLRGQIDKWNYTVREAWQTRSWAPFASQQSLLASRKLRYQQQYVRPVCDSLRQ